MINLLPPQDLSNLQAAKTNRLLLRYNILLLGAVGLIILALAFTYVVLGMGQNNAQATIDSNNQRVASYAKVRQQGAEFSKNLSTAKQIFASETNYTDLLVKIAQALPAGTSLQSLTLDEATIGKSTTIAANVASPQAALQLKDALAAKPKLFSNVYLLSITNGDTASKYPYTASLGVTINKGALGQ